MKIAQPIWSLIYKSIAEGVDGVVGGGSVPDASNRVLIAEGDSITSVLGSYPRIFEGNAAPQFTSLYVPALSGSKISDVVARANANIANKTGIGSNIYTILIGRNDLTTMTTTQWLTAMASHCDVMRAAGFYVGICTVLPSTAGGSFNTDRATVNTEMRLWTTNGSVISGVHADFIIDFDTTTMGPDAAASDGSLYYDGTHPTAAGQIVLEAKYRTIVNAQTSANVTAAPLMSSASGIYGSTQNVTLTSATGGASIFYTLDSSDPTTASTPYSGAITVSATQTIRAMASKTGKTNSACNDGIYTFGTTPSLTSLVAWYKFGAGTNNTASGVKRWEDRLFGRHVIQDTTTLRPSVSSGIVTFNNQYLRKVFALTQPCTFYALMRQDVWNSVSVMMDGATGNSGLYQLSSSPELKGYAGTFSSVNSNAAINTFVAVCIVFNGASSVLRVNNTTPVTGDFGAGDAGGLTLGATSAGSQRGRVSFKEVTVYNIAHGTPAQDAEITRLLAL